MRGSRYWVAMAFGAGLSAASLLADPTPPPAAAPASNEITVPVVPTAGASATPVAKDRIICRRELEIGSLVKGTRHCATASEWRKSTAAAQDTTQRIQDQKGTFTAP
jgi:hypothetical protein